MLRRLARQPLLHFLVLGGLLFAAQNLLKPRHPIHVTAADVQRLREDWRRETGRAPTPVELQASLDHWLGDEALLREALRLGLDRRDAVARRRLLMNLRFAFPDGPDDEAALLKDAEALEMQSSDVVVRRRLIQAMEQRLLGEQRLAERELTDYVAAHSERYGAHVRYRFRQVFLAAGRPPDDARRILAQLRAQPWPETLPGDPFLLGQRFDGLTAAEVARQLGREVAEAVAGAATGAWTGPVASPYGLHLLQVEEAMPGAPAAPDAVRRQAAYALLAEREAQALAAARVQLRQCYGVVVDDEGGLRKSA
ncbi:MAG: peptidyl-prolyl cis-trans isomerase [Gammaproteobacteria bacterium]|nr:peptidyl-prolyl cis-trans isomerase [Gammaproteobacteria bacterium]